METKTESFSFALYIEALKLKIQLLIGHTDIHPSTSVQVLKFTKVISVN